MLFCLMYSYVLWLVLIQTYLTILAVKSLNWFELIKLCYHGTSFHCWHHQLLLPTKFSNSFSYCLYFCLGGAFMVLMFAGYFGQRFLPPPAPKVVGIDLGEQSFTVTKLCRLWFTHCINHYQSFTIGIHGPSITVSTHQIISNW